MSVFAGYSNVSLVGEGGLARVYRATRNSTGGTVAIKEMRDVMADSPVWRQARRELDAMLKVKGHPYVVNVEEIIEGPLGPCIVMEYLAGGSLAERLANGALSLGEFVLVGSQVASALAAAHEVGVVHRDLKPQNLLLGQFGQVKVCDFGIASLMRNGSRTLVRAYTPAFASPEELAGADSIGSASDVYSFVATMACLGSGRLSIALVDDLGRSLYQVGQRSPALEDLVSVLFDGLRSAPHTRPTMNSLVESFAEASARLGNQRVSALLPHSPVAPDLAIAPTVLKRPVPASSASRSSAFAAWYSDPTGRFSHRYFDGSAWTAHVAIGNEVGVDWQSTSDVQQGWYTDPSGKYEHRYWNGETWTNAVSSAGTSRLDPTSWSGPFPGWYRDPSGKYERRYFNGSTWTQRVNTRGAIFEAAADWYADPTGRFELRYWNGSAWTEHIYNGGSAATDSV